MKKITPVLILVLFVFCVYAYFMSDIHSNNRNMNKLKRIFQNIKHYKGVEIIDKKAMFGLLVGNGNHCDYFVGLLCKYDGEFQEVAKYYSGLEFDCPINNQKDKFSIIRPVDGKFDAWLPYDADELTFWKHNNEKKVFLLYVFRSYEANNDLRCH